jgi:peptide/nickel transport system permease protein
MASFVARRLVLALPSLFGIVLMTFLVIRLIPGDAIDFRIGTSLGLSPEQVDTLKHYYGLDKPPIVQFGLWIASLAHGDFGISLRTGQPVIDLIGRALPVTLELAAFALLFAIVAGVSLGTFSALRSNTVADGAVRSGALLGLAAPEFLSGTLLIYLFSSYLNWYPNAIPYVPFTDDPITNLSQNLLPAFVLGLGVSGSILRFTRASVLGVMNEDHVRVARAKGLSDWRIVSRHIVRPALIPVVTIIGVMTGYLLTGAVIVEQLFNLPGLGRLLLTSILQRDYPVVQGTIVFIASAFILANLAADVGYRMLDPRIRDRQPR